MREAVVSSTDREAGVATAASSSVLNAISIILRLDWPQSKLLSHSIVPSRVVPKVYFSPITDLYGFDAGYAEVVFALVAAMHLLE